MGNGLRKSAARKTAAWLLCATLAAQGGVAVPPGKAEAGPSALQAELVKITPAQTNEVLHNPGMGWVL
ncbi:MAG: hypothetical protein K0Q63_2081, partial [Paenibacillus sp.]|nr:hypothetical protein [Paenibacillus sp.]